MPCFYCNSNKAPNSDGTCPDCGRVYETSDVSSSVAAATDVSPGDSDASPSVNEESQYKIQRWRCTWMIVFFHLVYAALMAGVLVGLILGLRYYDRLDGVPNAIFNEWQKEIWIAAMAIPVVYFVFGLIRFLYNRLIKKYELRPKEIRVITGFINTSTNSTLLESLWGMKLRQNLLQRFFGTGRITLFSDDVTSPVIHIDDLGRVRKRFNELVRYQNYALDCSNVKVERDVKIDTSVQVWRYSWRDFLDEIFWGIVIPFGLLLLGLYVPGLGKILTFPVVLTISVLYWIWLIWIYIDHICCTTYTLNSATMVKESGIFSKKIDVYVLCHVSDCEMSQNLWQKLVGDVGNITLLLRWENNEKTKGKGNELSKTMEDVLHGLKDHKKKYELCKERWLRERHRRQA